VNTFVVVGRIVNAHGVRGAVRVRWLGEGPEHLLGADEIWLADDPDDPEPRLHSVESTGGAAGADVRLQLAGLDDRDEAQALRGQLVLMREASLSTLDADEFYWHQLIGCRVEAEDGEAIGTVSSLLETGAHDVLVVDAPDGRQHMIPTAREFVTRIDLERGRIEVALIPGLVPPAEDN
jgi:16S rRNA processing protein RimM